MKSPVKRSKAKPKRPDFSRECPTLGIVCGVDEAGRGPLAGPVYAGCVYVPPEARKHPVWKEVRDSKQMTATRRDDLFAVIQMQSCFGIASATVAEIDEINILRASHLAMHRAIENMRAHFSIPKLDLALIDGNLAPKIDHPTQTVIKGDALSISIAAASILAKVSRDRHMHELHEAYPHYGWITNAGYSTAVHLSALETHGPCEHHRRSFAPCRGEAADEFHDEEPMES